MGRSGWKTTASVRTNKAKGNGGSKGFGGGDRLQATLVFESI